MTDLWTSSKGITKNELIHDILINLIDTANLNTKSSDDYLIDLLFYDDPIIQECVVFAISCTRRKKFISPILKLIKLDYSINIKLKAINALGEFSSTRVLNILLDLIEQEIRLNEKANNRMIQKALVSISKMPENLLSTQKDRLMNIIKICSKNPSKRTRQQVLFLISIIPSEKSIKIAIKMLKDKNRHVRIMAAQALGKFQTKEAIETLNKALGDSDIEVVYEAIRSLVHHRSFYNIAGAQRILMNLLLDPRPLPIRYKTTYKWLYRLYLAGQYYDEKRIKNKIPVDENLAHEMAEEILENIFEKLAKVVSEAVHSTYFMKKYA